MTLFAEQVSRLSQILLVPQDIEILSSISYREYCDKKALCCLFLWLFVRPLLLHHEALYSFGLLHRYVKNRVHLVLFQVNEKSIPAPDSNHYFEHRKLLLSAGSDLRSC